MGRTLEIEPFLAILFLTGLLLLVAVIALYFWKKREEQLEASRVDLDELLTAYEGDNPAFVKIMQIYRSKESLGELLENPEVEAALRELASRKAKSAEQQKRTRKDLGSSLLELSRPQQQRDLRSQAVMLTILRSIYSDHQLRRALPAAAEEELDALLESLTGGESIR